jgi:hypothetical protein
MIRALLIYVAALTAFIVAGTVATGTPLEAVAWLVLLVEVVPLATLGGAMLVRRMMRKARQDWQHLGCDPVSRLPVTRAVGEIVAPQTTKEIEHVTVDFPRISSAPVRAISAPPNHRERRAAD